MYSLSPTSNLDVVFRPADDFVGHHLLFAGHFVVPAAHEPLDRVDRPRGIGDGLPAGRLADQHVALVGERHDAGRQPVAFLVGDDLGFFAFHHGHDRVGGAQVDADDLFAASHGTLKIRRFRAPVILAVCVRPTDGGTAARSAGSQVPLAARFLRTWPPR